MSSSTVKSEGPFGGSGGNVWDDEIHSGIKKITVVYGAAIDSVTAEYYDEDGTSKLYAKRGGNGGSKTFTVSLDYPNEYLTLVSGRRLTDGVNTIVSSLTIQSNRRKFGPFGNEEGREFHFPPSSGGKIVGLHGRSGGSLDAIGGYVETITSNLVQAVGGKGGNAWDDGAQTSVRKLEVWYDSVIRSIRVEYESNENVVSPPNHGSQSGKSYKIELAYPNEFLTSISGFIRETPSPTVIQSLSFTSNKNKYGPIGEESGKPFSLVAEGEKIVGFHGTSDTSLDSIGIHTQLAPKQSENPALTPVHQSVGPFGGEGGGSWDDKVNEAVKKITIAINEDGIGIQHVLFEYINSGSSLLGKQHGGNQTDTLTFELDYPNEYLMSVTGYYDTIIGFSTANIQSLTFKTNTRTFGPKGEEAGTQFALGDSTTQILGFHGRAGDYLDAIGAYISTRSS